MFKIKLFSILLICLITLKNVLAYIDPGTTGMIIGGSIWPFILAVYAAIGGFFLKFFFKPVKKGVSGIWGRLRRKD